MHVILQLFLSLLLSSLDPYSTLSSYVQTIDQRKIDGGGGGEVYIIMATRGKSQEKRWEDVDEAKTYAKRGRGARGEMREDYTQ